MSKIVAAVACSHSPMLTFGPELWGRHATSDERNPELFDEFGALVSFDELAARNGGRYADRLNLAHWTEREQRCQQALDAQAAVLEAANPDVVVVVGNDQMELFDSSIQPLLAVFHGERFKLGDLEGPPPGEVLDAMRAGYGMIGDATYPSHPKLALHLIQSLLEADVDVTASAEEPAGRGMGHAYGFVLQRLIPDADIPLIPIMLNTCYPPNQPTPARCIQIGTALGAAIASGPPDLRVALVASGGLSHFVVDEALDRSVLDAISSSDLDTLAGISPKVLQAGSSEIRNWIVVAAAIDGTAVDVCEYLPSVRTLAGTGVGMGFITWASS